MGGVSISLNDAVSLNVLDFASSGRPAGRAALTRYETAGWCGRIGEGAILRGANPHFLTM